MAEPKVKSTGDMYIIIPRSNETIKEQYAVAGTKRLPFNVPLRLSKKDVMLLRRQKEPIQVDKQINVHEIMDKFSIDQQKANKMAKLTEANPEMGGKSIQFVSKYIVSKA